MPIKVALLAPPGRRLYLRDYYCSKVSKSNYLTHPVDLLMLSGRLAERFELRVIDAVADRLNERVCRDLLEQFAPDVIISLIGAVSLEEDLAFLGGLTRRGRRLIVTGDVVLDDTLRWLESHPFVDAALLDFTDSDVIRYIEGDKGPFTTVVPAGQAGERRYERPLNQEFSLPVPRHDLFTSPNYRYPFLRHKRFATVLTDYGCPHRCAFCIMGTLGYKYRPVDNVLAELQFVRRLGIRDIYFSDQTFGAQEERTVALCRRMEEERFGFNWACFTRADLITERLLGAMQRAGCHTVKIGVESASDDILEAYRKGFPTGQVREAFRICRQLGVRTVATFILGLPEETVETALATIRFAKELDCDYASFNVAVPRAGTMLRTAAIGSGLISPDLQTMDQSGTEIAMPTRTLTVEQLEHLRARAIRDFYLRPPYLLRRALGIRTLHELREHLVEAWALLRSLRQR